MPLSISHTIAMLDGARGFPGVANHLSEQGFKIVLSAALQDIMNTLDTGESGFVLVATSDEQGREPFLCVNTKEEALKYGMQLRDWGIAIIYVVPRSTMNAFTKSRTGREMGSLPAPDRTLQQAGLTKLL